MDPMRRPSAFVAFLLCALLGRPDAATSLQPGDLLVTDATIGSLLRVRPNGAVSTLSAPDLVANPYGIGVGADGEILVVDSDGTVVQVDPTTGDQYAVAGLSGPPDLGTSPRDVALNPRTPAPFQSPTLYVAALGELRQVLRSPLDAVGSSLAPYPTGYENYEGLHVSPLDPGGQAPLDLYVATQRHVFHYDGALGATSSLFTPPSGFVTGLDVIAVPSGAAVLVSFVDAACPSNGNGVYRYYTGISVAFEPLSTGNLLACPGALAIAPAGFPVYVIDRGQEPQRIIQVNDLGVIGIVQEPFATLPAGTQARDIAVWVPEAEGPLAGWAAALALGAAARRSRGRR